MANRAYAVPTELGAAPDVLAFYGSGGLGADAYRKAEGEYIGKIVEYAKKRGTGNLRGKQIAIPMGDGHALYVILNTSPLELIHVPVCDAWHSPLVNQLTVAALKKMAFNYNPADYQ